MSAAVRFVSFEPLIGSVGVANLTSIEWAIVGANQVHGRGLWIGNGSMKFNWRVVGPEPLFSSNNGAVRTKPRPAANSMAEHGTNFQHDTSTLLSSRCISGLMAESSVLRT